MADGADPAGRRCTDCIVHCHLSRPRPQRMSSIRARTGHCPAADPAQLTPRVHGEDPEPERHAPAPLPSSCTRIVVPNTSLPSTGSMHGFHSLNPAKSISTARQPQGTRRCRSCCELSCARRRPSSEWSAHTSELSSRLISLAETSGATRRGTTSRPHPVRASAGLTWGGRRRREGAARRRPGPHPEAQRVARQATEIPGTASLRNRWGRLVAPSG